MKLFVLREEKENEEVLLTPWSFIHFLSGVAAKGFGMKFWTFEAAHAVYELKDHLNKTVEWNSTTNSVGDQLIATLGHYLGPDKHTLDWVYIYLLAFLLAILLKRDGEVK